jgi:hypothetical protein
MKHFFRKYRGTLVLGLILTFLIILLAPVVSFLSPKFLFSRHLILFTNEAEARPCGGFLTAYGEFQIFPPKFFLKNSYAMEDVSFGTSAELLASLNPELKFWDLGQSLDVGECAALFRQKYSESRLEGAEMGAAILVDFRTVEQLFALLGHLDLEGENITADNAFSYLTRTVANVDRHDESSLAERKTPLANLGKKIVKKAIFQPWNWSGLTRFVAAKVQSGEIFVEGISPEFKPAPEDFSVIEWNLGGAKTSRFLQKKLNLTFREILPHHWEGEGKFSIQNVGLYDEPLSQVWKGTVEFRFPEVLHAQTEFFSGTLAPGGDAFEKEFRFSFQGNIDSVSLFQPRGQDLFGDVTVTTYPQQAITSSRLDTHENVGHFFGKFNPGRNVFAWTREPDADRPFVTFHEVVSLQNMPEDIQKKFEPYLSEGKRELSIAEIHFNESVVISPERKIEILDKNFVNKDISDYPEFKIIEMLPDQRSAVIGFWRDGDQESERFSMNLSGISDLWGNEISDQLYTLMIRYTQPH